MKIKSYQSINSRTDFFYYTFRNILLISLPLLVVSGFVLSVSHSSASELSQADNLAVSIPTACSLSSIINGEHSKAVLNGTYESGIGQTILTTYCNDKNGYVVYAIGSSNNELGNNKLISNINDNLNNYDIVSGTATSGTTSNWAMKLSTSDIDSTIINTNVGEDTPNIESAYNNTYAIVPNTWTKVASKSAGTVTSTTGSSFTTTYAVYASTTQPAGSYIGQVRYLLAHPYIAPAVYYMQDVATWKDQLQEEESILAVDKRDYKSYYVTKLKDGHIWMTQNLAIDLGEIDNAGNVTMRTFTSEDTDLTDHSLTGAYADGYTYDENTDITTWTPADSAATIKFKETSIPGWTSSNVVPASATKIDGPNTGHESLGNYYNWTAAIASNESSTLRNETIGNITNNPKNSICPKGWRLPTISNQSNAIAGSTNEFSRLNYIYNDEKTSGENSDVGLIIEPLWLTKPGAISVYGSSIDGYGNLGNYWSSTVRSLNVAYSLSLSINNINPLSLGANSKFGGKSIRCVAR